MKISEAAKALNKSTKTIHRWIADGTIKAHMMGGMWEITEDEIIRLKRGE